MTTRVHDNLVKGIFLIILFIIVLLRSALANAAPGKNLTRITDKITAPYANSEPTNLLDLK